MRTTIDKAGRVVIPKELRERIGLRPGTVDITVEGSALRIEVIGSDHLVEYEGSLLIPADPDRSVPITAEDIQALRDADQR